MLAPPVAENRVTPGLGWPRKVEVDPRIGWPTVPRETLDWTKTTFPKVNPSSPAATTTTAPPSIQLPPGPRRARFDEDEFGSPPVEDDPPAVSTAERPATASLPAPPLPASSSSPTRRVASARPQRASTWRLPSRSAGSRCSWWISIPRETPRLRSELTIHPARPVRTRC